MNWITKKFYDMSSSNAYLQIPYITYLVYNVSGVVERDCNRHPHNTVEELRAAMYSVANVPNTDMIIACSWFRPHVRLLL